MVHLSNAVSTQFLDEESVDDLTDKCVNASQNWSKTAERLYKEHKSKK
jgi:hypothetical protein